MNQSATLTATTEFAANPHMLQRVMALAGHSGVEASEDIFSAQGVKLVGKGARLGAGMQERLLRHKLRKPLERTLAVSDLQLPALSVLAAEQAAQSAVLQTLLGPGALAALDRLAAGLHGQGSRLQLALLLQHGRQALAHATLNAAVAIELAQRLGWESAVLDQAGLAGLFHDAGELYIDPALLAADRQLSPEEWRHVLVHPLIGARVVRDTGEFPDAVARAIEEHHERCNGSGYPRGLRGGGISPLGRLLAVSNLLVTLCHEQRWPLYRIGLALRMIGGEYDPALVGLIASEVRAQPQAAGAWPGQDLLLPAMHGLLLRVGQIVVELQRCEALPLQPDGRQLLAGISLQFQHIQRAFSSTGLDQVESEQLLQGDPTPGLLEQELAAILDEIDWRLRDLGRRMATLCVSLSPDQQILLQPLLDLLAVRPAQAA
ncbi:HD-GYP domain-containing protein [Chitinilyticum litopenaei]|uniref:HD-GYP domain-containing protein n=1 Tax=Chitinilyticum litopenaei TaxID=1121276 RepID=UPI0003F9FDC4|nr:HD domain-containing phosphohydrolase [Chitinilyticum litopenaei]